MSNPHYLKYKETIKKAAKEWREKQDPDYLKRKINAGMRYHYHNNKEQILQKKKIERILNKEQIRLFNMFDIYT